MRPPAYWNHRAAVALVGLVLLFLTACSVTGGGPTLTPAQEHFDIGQRYVEVGAIVAEYVNLPLCSEPFGSSFPRCAREEVVRALQAADNEAYLLVTARNYSEALSLAAIRQLRALLVRYAIKEVLQ